MNVQELITLLGALPPGATVDAIHKGCVTEAFPVAEVELVELQHGRCVCVLTIVDGPLMKVVA